MAKSPLANMMAQAVAPGAPLKAPGGKTVAARLTSPVVPKPPKAARPVLPGIGAPKPPAAPGKPFGGKQAPPFKPKGAGF
jgi:hypothetical protein